MKKELKLKNLNVVFFESRLAKTLGDLIRLQGGHPVSAPSMQEVPLENNRSVFLFAEKLFSGQADVLVLLTGVGARVMLSVLETKYPRAEILSALKRITIIPRGPKPARALHEWGLTGALTVPEPNTWKELLLALDGHQKEIPLKDRHVFVQEYGISNFQLLDGLKKRGAQVTPVPVYRWELPEDLEPLKQSIRSAIAGSIQVVMFTTAVQVEHLLKVARFLGLESELKRSLQRVVIASVGPDCTEALRARRIEVDVQPESPKMGPLVTETAERAQLILKNKMSSPKVFIGDQPNRHLEDDRLIPAKSIAGMTKRSEKSSVLLEQSAFMKACRLEKTSITPVWLMRQAGRYMKEYRRVRDRVPFLEICKNKDLVTEITVVAQEKLKADAAIIFSDILLLVESFGLGLEYLKGDGPSIRHAIRSAGDVERLPDLDPAQSLGFVFQAIRQTRHALDPSIPLIGFAGAPFTLASYMIEGGSSEDFKKTKQFMRHDPGVWKMLMEKIVFSTTQYLNAQIHAGVQAVQIFDSWVGNISHDDYKNLVFPYSSRLIQGLKKGVPVIHFGTGTGGFLEPFSAAGGDVIGVDHRIELGVAWQRIGTQKAIQGNLDPQVLCTDLENIRGHVEKILASANGRAGHIFNLGHGVLQETPVANAIALIDMVHELSSR